ncbi:MAG: hypothetical protein KKF89_02205 [Nanoarchaeota archaeon]|nr:hypothetical protein [Nanoarchaeota archaeon]MBU1854507.1 hypothetical protein [Nanoarchaeota archaeon]
MNTKKEDDLEERIKNKHNLVNTFKNQVSEYIIDTTSRIFYYIPTIGMIELMCGLESNEIKKSRFAALVMSTFLGVTHKYTRKLSAKIHKADVYSSLELKRKSDRRAGFVVGLASYLIAISYSGVPLKEAGLSTVLTMSYALLTGHIFGSFHDWYRQEFGRKGILYQN